MGSIFFFVLFGSLAYGHNWMQEPLSYNANKASAGNMPCNTKGSTYTTPSIPQMTNITVKWTDNHVNNPNPHIVKVVALTDIAMVETMESTPLYYFEMVKTKTSVVPVNEKFIVGTTYLLQYSWANYRNCAEFTVEKPIVVPTASPTGSNSPTKFSDTIGLGDCNIYCEDFARLCNTTSYAYNSLNECLDACARFPNNGVYRSPTGNSFQCRWYHLHPDPGHSRDSQIHCSHSSRESTKETCQGQEPNLPAANVRIMLTPGAIVTPEAMKIHVQDCLTENGYTSLTVATPSQGNGGYTVPIIFAKTVGKGETELQKIAALKFDQQAKRCMENKQGIQSFSVASTDFDDSLGGANKGNPAAILSVVAILFYVLFQ